MATNFFNLSAEQQLALIKKAGDKFDLSDMIIEKDLWICWVLEKIFELPVKMVFKGGTSLSKGFDLIKRFSEDCDITIDYRNFQPELDLQNLPVRSQLKKLREELKAQLSIYVSEKIVPHLQEQASKMLFGNTFNITLSDNGEELRFYYPSVIDNLTASSGYLKDNVLIEFGAANITEPCSKHQISPYLKQVASSDLDFPEPMINILSPIRTFWEKATLIHVECHHDNLNKDPERLSRHWYDLWMLNDSWVGKEALSSSEILKSVVQHKEAFYRAAYSHYDDCLGGKLRLIPGEKYLNNLRQDFLKMIESEMFYGVEPKFSIIMEALEKLETLINQMEISHSK